MTTNELVEKWKQVMDAGASVDTIHYPVLAELLERTQQMIESKNKDYTKGSWYANVIIPTVHRHFCTVANDMGFIDVKISSKPLPPAFIYDFYVKSELNFMGVNSTSDVGTLLLFELEEYILSNIRGRAKVVDKDSVNIDDYDFVLLNRDYFYSNKCDIVPDSMPCKIGGMELLTTSTNYKLYLDVYNTSYQYSYILGRDGDVEYLLDTPIYTDNRMITIDNRTELKLNSNLVKVL
jgi:hypothetical protein